MKSQYLGSTSQLARHLVRRKLGSQPRPPLWASTNVMMSYTFYKHTHVFSREIGPHLSHSQTSAKNHFTGLYTPCRKECVTSLRESSVLTMGPC